MKRKLLQTGGRNHEKSPLHELFGLDRLSYAGCAFCLAVAVKKQRMCRRSHYHTGTLHRREHGNLFDAVCARNSSTINHVLIRSILKQMKSLNAPSAGMERKGMSRRPCTLAPANQQSTLIRTEAPRKCPPPKNPLTVIIGTLTIL